MAARKKVQADPSVARRKSLDYLADDDGDDDIRRDMVARRLSYQQHKSGTGIFALLLSWVTKGSSVVFLKVENSNTVRV